MNLPFMRGCPTLGTLWGPLGLAVFLEKGGDAPTSGPGRGAGVPDWRILRETGLPSAAQRLARVGWHNYPMPGPPCAHSSRPVAGEPLFWLTIPELSRVPLWVPEGQDANS